MKQKGQTISDTILTLTTLLREAIIRNELENGKLDYELCLWSTPSVLAVLRSCSSARYSVEVATVIVH